MAESKGTVLLTGVNGYIGAVTAKAYLDDGYSVRGTSRSKERTLKQLGEALKTYIDEGRFDVYEVPDIEVPGAFDEAVKGKRSLEGMTQLCAN